MSSSNNAELILATTGLSRDKLAEMKNGVADALALLSDNSELLDLPEEAVELLIAAGYIRQHEWHELYPRMKERQKRAKDEREANFHEVIRTVLSGERERPSSLGYEGQDPDAYLENVRSFFDAGTFEYNKGGWKNVHLPDALRDRSMQPKSLDQIKESVSYSIPAPTRSEDEQWHYRRAERIMFTLQDVYLKNPKLGDVFRTLEDTGFLDEGMRYEDPAISGTVEGLAKVRAIHERLGRLSRKIRLDFVWSETKVTANESDDLPERIVHLEYALLNDEDDGNDEDNAEDNAEDASEVTADYAIGPEGRISSIAVQWASKPSKAFLESYSSAVNEETDGYLS